MKKKLNAVLMIGFVCLGFGFSYGQSTVTVGVSCTSGENVDWQLNPETTGGNPESSPQVIYHDSGGELILSVPEPWLTGQTETLEVGDALIKSESGDIINSQSIKITNGGGIVDVVIIDI